MPVVSERESHGEDEVEPHGEKTRNLMEGGKLPLLAQYYDTDEGL